MNAYELSNLIGGWELGRAYAAQCPICNNDKATLSIWDTDDGIGLKCFYNSSGQCHPLALIYHWQSIGVPISVDDLSSGKHQPSKTWDAIWNGAKPIMGSFAEDYLASRAIHIDRWTDWKCEIMTKTLRCIDHLKHPTAVRYPAMIALIVNPVTDEPKAIHRTYLNHLGNGKAPVEPNKMSLGPARGGVVKFGDFGSTMTTVAGGIETAMSFSIMAGCQVWATIGEGNMSFIEFPPNIKHVGLVEDQDKAGREAVAAAQGVYHSRGLTTEVYKPHPPFKDMNDMLIAEEKV